MSEALDRYIEEDRRSRGRLPPEDEGFFGEMGKGACTSFFTLLKPFAPEYSEEVLRSNQQWRSPVNPSPMSMTGRLIGICWPLDLILIGLAIWYIFRRLKRCRAMRKAVQALREERQIEALSELESGNLDRLSWAQALVAAKGNEEKARGKYLEIRAKRNT